jgi:hypothetical protein
MGDFSRFQVHGPVIQGILDREEIDDEIGIEAEIGMAIKCMVTKKRPD